MPGLLPISALQHLLYCERQCALIHIEQMWAENQFTVEGKVMHEKAHEGADETKACVRIARGLAVKSEALGLFGQCDVVEFHPVGTRCAASDCNHAAASGLPNHSASLGSDSSPRWGSILPIEYKRGKPKAHRADEVQLCAQAICLEETLGVVIPEGRLFYGQTRRRTDVVFDPGLRAFTTDTARRLREMIESRRTPPAVYEQRKCEACSLKELCLPHVMRFQKGAGAWFNRQMTELANSSPL